MKESDKEQREQEVTRTDFSLNRFPPDRSVSLLGELGLVNCRVDSTEALKTFLELEREAVVGLDLGEEEGVTTTVFGLSESKKHVRRSRGKDVRMMCVPDRG